IAGDRRAVGGVLLDLLAHPPIVRIVAVDLLEAQCVADVIIRLGHAVAVVVGVNPIIARIGFRDLLGFIAFRVVLIVPGRIVHDAVVIADVGAVGGAGGAVKVLVVAVGAGPRIIRLAVAVGVKVFANQLAIVAVAIELRRHTADLGHLGDPV